MSDAVARLAGRMRAIVAWACAIVLAGACAGATSPQSQPADISRSSAIEQRPIRAAIPSGAERSGTASSAMGAWDMTRVVLSLGTVLGLIFAVRWAGKRFFGLQSPSGGSGAIQVLSRSVMSPRQQVLLIRVGRRILVVASSGVQMNTLCQISDPDEVAALLGRSEVVSDGSAAFTSAFSRANEAFDPEEDVPDDSTAPDGDAGPDGPVAETRAELGGLMDKVKTLSRAFRRT